jgi:hypothetical protein
VAEPETLQKQYEELCRSYRAIEEFRGKLMGLLPLASGVGWITLLTSKNAPRAVLILVGIVGAVITVGLYIYEARGAQRCRRLMDVAKDLEEQLGLEEKLGQFRSEPSPLAGFVREGVAGGVVYLGVLIGWLGLVIYAAAGEPVSGQAGESGGKTVSVHVSA